jgi:hypothetical protein
VGMRKVRYTGPVFLLDNGREVPMPHRDRLRQPEGSYRWNDRYYLHIAETLGDEIADEVEAYRTECAPYSTEIAAAWQIVQRMHDKGRHFLLMSTHESGLSIASFYLGPHDRADSSATEALENTPLAICRAALKALGVVVV